MCNHVLICVFIIPDFHALFFSFLFSSLVFDRHIVYVVDEENFERSLLFPHLTKAIREFRRKPKSLALHSVREHLSMALNALRKATDLLNRSLLTGKSTPP